MVSREYALWVVLTVFMATYALRVLPFVVFGKKNPPDVILFLGRVISPAAIAMLVIYCFKDVQILSGNFAIPELFATITVVGLHLWLKNPLLSILVGTAVYIYLVQVVFS